MPFGFPHVQRAGENSGLGYGGSEIMEYIPGGSMGFRASQQVEGYHHDFLSLSRKGKKKRRKEEKKTKEQQQRGNQQ